MLSKRKLVSARGVSKAYDIYGSPLDRIISMLWFRPHRTRSFHALSKLDLDIYSGQSIGIIGKNGAGKSTLLQLICGVLTPTTGKLQVNGRVAPLLELGAGFSPRFTGRENIFLNAALLGFSKEETVASLQDIITFADIGSFIDQPVRTYSSGMYVRLAFAIATTIRPDILVIDEAIAVGDGQFARKSFDRIFQLKEQGVTLIFCSHSLFQVEALCEEALWLHQGKLQAQGSASSVISEYETWMNQQSQIVTHSQISPRENSLQGYAKFTNVKVCCDGIAGFHLRAINGFSKLEIYLSYQSDPELPPPTVGVTIDTADGRMITSNGSWVDGIELERDSDGKGSVNLIYPKLPLLKGKYSLSVFLMCERGIHVYDAAEHIVTIIVEQEHILPGLVTIPHQWLSPDNFENS
ncbi:ABC transporter ATP-binding protein [Cyanobacterium aponinum AL20118]|uniref:ABC transporter ATP-binding protein n=1 Tax=Cyanobacterium aponinum AL20115 TaxID=3090662 RepID=A0AAF1C557_9CHRO|nr:ABC transporter ATP-binding protein [Cyanobacterium aponinum]WPF88241.1 ABC transporter ATP-binding protein [Cyanobacterium aponinum AL20115]